MATPPSSPNPSSQTPPPDASAHQSHQGTPSPSAQHQPNTTTPSPPSTAHADSTAPGEQPRSRSPSPHTPPTPAPTPTQPPLSYDTGRRNENNTHTQAPATDNAARIDALSVTEPGYTAAATTTPTTPIGNISPARFSAVDRTKTPSKAPYVAVSVRTNNISRTPLIAQL